MPSWTWYLFFEDLQYFCWKLPFKPLEHLFAAAICSDLAHSGASWLSPAFLWTLGRDLLSAVTWCWRSNGWDDPVETGVVPPWIFPICRVQGAAHYLVVPLKGNGMKQVLWARIAKNRRIRACKAKDKRFKKSIQNLKWTPIIDVIITNTGGRASAEENCMRASTHISLHSFWILIKWFRLTCCDSLCVCIFRPLAPTCEQCETDDGEACISVSISPAPTCCVPPRDSTELFSLSEKYQQNRWQNTWSLTHGIIYNRIILLFCLFFVYIYIYILYIPCGTVRKLRYYNMDGGSH